MRIINPKLFRTKATLLFLSGFFSVGGLTACALPAEKSDQPTSIERVYSASHEEVERAIKQVMVKYPQKIDNLDAGIFETDYIKGDQRWKSPASNVHYGAGYRYRLVIHVLKGKRDKKHPAVKVIVTKVVEEQPDFFSDADNKTSDGLEELTVLYRIQREISMEKNAQRAQEKLNQDSRQSYRQ